MYNVLLVDDEYMILSGLERLINWDELNLKLVGKANDGQAALDFVKNNPVDIVITDVSMPEMTGIDFIRASQQEGINFYFIIFSGYQEFEYVKDGINLGAENFLLKPINKEELNTTLENTVKKLEQEQERVKNQRLIFANTLYQWVNDDLDMVNLKRRLHDFDIVLRENDLFTAMIVVGIKEEQREDFRKLLSDLGQNLNFFIDERLTIIVRGGERELDLVQAEMNKMKQLHDVDYGVGELFVDIDSVPDSYNQAESFIEILDFYKGHHAVENITVSDSNYTLSEMHPISFKKMRHALSIGDYELIESEMKAIFQELISNGSHPSYVKYLSFIIFSDIDREFECFDKEKYQEIAKKLDQAETYEDLEMILLSSLESTRDLSEMRTYNPNVQKVLEIVFDRFSEDLSISLIAEELHLNPMYLGQLFKKEMKKSFSQYLNNFRVKEAQLLLNHSNYNVNEIASLVGYSSSGYFYKNFKKECGLSPGEYREMYQDKKSED